MKPFFSLLFKSALPAAGTLFAAAIACRAAGEATQAHAEETGIPVKISERARLAVAMRFEKVVSRPTEALRVYYGVMTVPAGAEKTAALPAAGRVRFFVAPGQKFEAGTPLFSLLSPDLVAMRSDVLSAEAELSRAETNLATLEKRLARLEEIGTKNSALESEAAFLKADVPVLKASVERARAQWETATAGARFENGELVVPAPEGGRVQALGVSEGAWGERGAGALTFVADAPLEFKGTAFGNDDFSDAEARLAIEVGDETRRLAGTLRAAAQVDEATQSRVIYFAPEKTEFSVYPGQIARLEVFPRGAAGGAFVSVPSSAVIKVGTDDVVFVRDPHDENAFFARKVETLPSRRGMTPVKGVSVGETVVSEGGYELKYVLPADGNGPAKKAAGHFHADGKFHEGEH